MPAVSPSGGVYPLHTDHVVNQSRDQVFCFERIVKTSRKNHQKKKHFRIFFVQFKFLENFKWVCSDVRYTEEHNMFRLTSNNTSRGGLCHWLLTNGLFTSSHISPLLGWRA